MKMPDLHLASCQSTATLRWSISSPFANIILGYFDFDITSTFTTEQWYKDLHAAMSLKATPSEFLNSW